MKFDITRGIVRYQDKFVLLKRASDPIPENIGKWECPGGRIKENETPHENILREVQEKLGVPCTLIKKISYFDYHTSDIQSTAHIFLLEASSDEFKLSEEHSDWKLVIAEEVQNEKLVLFASLLLEYFRNPDVYELFK